MIQQALSNTGLPGRRINVVGTSGSGKTTMARNLAARLGVPHVELDELHWGPNWTEEPDELFRERVERLLVGEGWATAATTTQCATSCGPAPTRSCGSTILCL